MKTPIIFKTVRLYLYVPEVLNVHVNESKKNVLFLEFFIKQWKINVWERKCDCIYYFFKS